MKKIIEKTIYDLRSEGCNPYYIYGNSDGKGNESIILNAYRKVYDEIKGKYDYVFVPCGIGMTLAGLQVGKNINNGKEHLVGISIARSSKDEINILRDYLLAYSDSNHLIIKNLDVIVVDDYLCGGYGLFVNDPLN